MNRRQSNTSHMRAVDVIAKKRDGAELSGDEIAFIVRGYTAGQVPDYQMAALLMATYLGGMTPSETLALTNEMLRSGAVLDLSDLGRSRVDKHSTGGVGDKTSLVVAPVVAAAGVLVPMISGRSLAHSGGTLDKLESIPGFRTDLTLSEFRSALANVGAALIGQTAEIAPADKKLYALRDVTGTVACPPLMAASIMSKKLAEGIDGLVLDVKFGSGAFLKTDAEARSLAGVMIGIARGMDKQCVALITDMNQPLGRAVGNSLEVKEAFEVLHGRGPSDLVELCRELAAEMLVLGGAVNGLDGGRNRVDEVIRSGAGLEKMRQIISTQQGRPRVVDDYTLLPHASHIHSVRATTAGYVRAIDTEAIGRAAMLLGAGRTQLDTAIDHAVGLEVAARIGDKVDRSSILAELHFNDSEVIDEVAGVVQGAYVIGSEAPLIPELVRARLT
ncbi:MAG TPA: thymidine phosphorylase [Blastocatellia bacterium]|nr:thymidine phosphorylase [Blastocatellia bacterium]